MSESSAHEYPYLHAFIGGWFHQDYDLDGETLEEIVASFKRRSPERDWQVVRTDIERFLSERDEEQVAADFPKLFQPDVGPAEWGMTPRDWLATLSRLLHGS
jgi:hypothetical protein